MRILAVDPGPVESAYCLCSYDAVLDAGKVPNREIFDMLNLHIAGFGIVLAIEMVACYGMAVGAEVFETVRWIGRFQQFWRAPDEVHLVYRAEVKMELCGNTRAKDANIRQALIDRFGGKEKAIGNKKSPGPLYGLKGDMWSALAVAVTAERQLQIKQSIGASP